MVTRREAMFAGGAALASCAAGMNSSPDQRVRLTRVPGGGLQPQAALDAKGNLHLLYYTGDARHGDLFYVRSADFGKTFSSPLRVNSQPGSAVAAGTIRGGQLALGRDSRVHVAWNGSMQAEPKGPLNPDSGKRGMPMLYARLNDAGSAFEPQRNLMHHSFGLDGGGSVAADPAGNVYAAWHGVGLSEASGTGKQGEARRRVWVTKSSDDGRSFSQEKPAWPEETGACGCCGMKLFSERNGNLFALYRSATESVHRDIYLLTSGDKGASFQGRLLHRWEINACPMSSMDFAGNGNMVAGAWETGGQVYWARVSVDRGASKPIAASGDGKNRKHPRLAVNQRGEVLLAWAEGTGWQKGGLLAWQLFGPTGQPLSENRQVPAIPVWSFAAAVPAPDNTFVVFY